MEHVAASRATVNSAARGRVKNLFTLKHATRARSPRDARLFATAIARRFRAAATLASERRSKPTLRAPPLPRALARMQLAMASRAPTRMTLLASTAIPLVLLVGGAVANLNAVGPSRAKPAPRASRRVLLVPQDNPGSRYRFGRST